MSLFARRRVRMKTAAGTGVFSFRNEGLNLVGQTWTPPNRKGTVVLLHGGGQTRHAWTATAEILVAAGWRVVAYDARGHGDSEWSALGDYGVDANAADLRSLVEQLDDVPVLVGASMGGIVSIVAVADDPALARAIVLVDIAVRIEEAGSRRIREFMTSAPDGFGSLEEVADAVQSYRMDRRRPRNVDGLRKNVRQRANGRWYWHWDPEFLRIGDEPHRDVTENRTVAAATQISVPTLIVRGAHSDVVSQRGLAETRELIPHAEFVEVDAGHMVAGDDNAVFARAVCQFLDRQLTAESGGTTWATGCSPTATACSADVSSRTYGRRRARGHRYSG